jgi:hypothetical protein
MCFPRLSLWASNNQYQLVAAVVASALLLPSCSTRILTENTLDVATTVDDLNTRQVLFNLVKTKEQQFALPSQLQISGGSVGGSSSLTPSLSFPVTPSLSTTTSATTTSASRTITTSWGQAAVGGGVNGSAMNMDSWQVTFMQDPEQYRRLRLLYQYGADQISWGDLACRYPIPELPADQQQSQTEQGSAPIRRYVRVLGQGEKEFIGCNPPNVVLVGDNPNPAFLNFPDCIICAFPNANFDNTFKKYLKNHRNVKIFKGSYSGQFGLAELEDYSDKYEYVPAVLNNRLAPNSALLSPTASIAQWHEKIDWLSVVKDGVDAVPDDARRVGGWGAYTVYVHPLSVQSENAFTGDEHFSEFVLAVMAALLQPAELQKVGATPPPVVRTSP